MSIPRQKGGRGRVKVMYQLSLAFFYRKKFAKSLTQYRVLFIYHWIEVGLGHMALAGKESGGGRGVVRNFN